MPEPLSLMGDGAATERFFAGLDGLPGVRLIPSTAPGVNSFAATAPPLEGLEGLGRIALLAGDACMTGLELVRILGDSPNVAVLAPRSENDLQAEAVMELAIGLSESLAGLVVVTECAGAEPGDCRSRRLGDHLSWRRAGRGDGSGRRDALRRDRAAARQARASRAAAEDRADPLAAGRASPRRAAANRLSRRADLGPLGVLGTHAIASRSPRSRAAVRKARGRITLASRLRLQAFATPCCGASRTEEGTHGLPEGDRRRRWPGRRHCGTALGCCTISPTSS